MLPDVELAFAENLVLSGTITGPTLVYALRLRQQSGQPLWEGMVAEGLIAPEHAAQAHQLALASVEAMGPQAFSFSEGAMVGPWELELRKGQAIGGEVWQASRPGGQRATLRLIAPGSGQDPLRTPRFVERSNVGLDPPHPSILKVDEADEDFGWLYAATLGLECTPVAAMTGEGPLDEGSALALAQSLAGSLSVVHGLGVVHGGLSSLAVLLQDQRVYLSDFGACAALLDGPASGSRPGSRAGIALYASPQLLSSGEDRGLDGRDDLYAMGVLLYQAVCHAQPGAPRAAPQAPWPVEPPISPGFRAILARLLARDEDARYPSATLLMNDLTVVAQGGVPTPQPAMGPSIRGRRHPGAEPQVLFGPELIQQAAPAAPLAPAPLNPAPIVEVAGAAPLAPQAPPPPEEELAEDEEWVYEDEDADAPRKEYQAPDARASAADRFQEPAQTVAAKASGGWPLFFSTTLIVLIGLGAAFGLTQPKGEDARQQRLSVALQLSTAEQPNFAEALIAAREALELASSTETQRDAMREFESVEERALRARLKLLPAGSDAKREDVIPQRDALIELKKRCEGTRALALINYDLARSGDTVDLPTWQAVGADLLRLGFPVEARVAFDRGSKPAQEAVARAATHMVYVRGGPWLEPKQKGEGLQVVERKPVYVGRTEVTRKAYAAFLAASDVRKDPRVPEDKVHTPAEWAPAGDATSALPVTGVDFFDAIAYARYRGLQLASADALVAAARGPLCLEQPWAAAGAPAFDPAAKATWAPYVNAGDLLAGPAPVGAFAAGRSPCGALNLLGNVNEWTEVERGGASPVFGGNHATPLDKLGPTLSEPLAWEERRANLGFRLSCPAAE